MDDPNFSFFIFRNMLEAAIDSFFLYYAIRDYRYFGKGLKGLFFPSTKPRDVLTYSGSTADVKGIAPPP